MKWLHYGMQHDRKDRCIDNDLLSWLTVKSIRCCCFQCQVQWNTILWIVWYVYFWGIKIYLSPIRPPCLTMMMMLLRMMIVVCGISSHISGISNMQEVQGVVNCISLGTPAMEQDQQQQQHFKAAWRQLR